MIYCAIPEEEMEVYMIQPSRCLESATDRGDQREQETQVMPARDFAKPCPDPVRVSVEIAREWAFLGGD